jgi:hypothetical protein
MLKADGVSEFDDGDVVVRYPVTRSHDARAALEVLRAVWPVVERYLDATWQGRLRLDLLDEARMGGANAAAGIVRHALRGFEARSPATAGVLSYQLGHVLWYAATAEAIYRGPTPRCPDWLQGAVLLPLTHVWSPREVWLDHVASHVRRFTRAAPLPEAALEDHAVLRPRDRALATSQSLLRGQSLLQRHPTWVVDLRRHLEAHPQTTGLAGLEAVTGHDGAWWRARFDDDLRAWRASDDEWRGPVA